MEQEIYTIMKGEDKFTYLFYSEGPKGKILKVLHTVAEAARSFMNFWPDAIIILRGSTASRTRLYQMGIAAFWEEIGLGFQVWGEFEEEWVPFKKGVNYSGFLVFNKIN